MASEIKAPQFQRHVFVCTNERAADNPRGCCKAKNSEELLNALKSEARKAGMKNIRIQKAGCLDICEAGAAMVVYPEGTWYGHVQVADAEEIVKSHLQEGKPVERLKLSSKS